LISSPFIDIEIRDDGIGNDNKREPPDELQSLLKRCFFFFSSFDYKRLFSLPDEIFMMEKILGCGLFS
jgi:hypothetical protein